MSLQNLGITPLQSEQLISATSPGGQLVVTDLSTGKLECSGKVAVAGDVVLGANAVTYPATVKFSVNEFATNMSAFGNIGIPATVGHASGFELQFAFAFPAPDQDNVYGMALVVPNSCYIAAGVGETITSFTLKAYRAGGVEYYEQANISIGKVTYRFSIPMTLNYQTGDYITLTVVTSAGNWEIAAGNMRILYFS
jgi:hypothetical protein